jgi:hypothetical protein
MGHDRKTGSSCVFDARAGLFAPEGSFFSVYVHPPAETPNRPPAGNAAVARLPAVPDANVSSRPADAWVQIGILSAAKRGQAIFSAVAAEVGKLAVGGKESQSPFCSRSPRSSGLCRIPIRTR